MELFVFTPYFYPHQDGLSFFNLDLLSRCVKAGCQVTVITSGNSMIREDYEGIKIYRLDSWDILGGYPIPKPTRTFFRILKKLPKGERGFVITNTRFFTFSLLGLLFARLRKIRLLHIEHGTRHPKLKNHLLSFSAHLYDHTLGFLIIKHADKVIGVCESSSGFIKHLGGTLDFVLPNSVDPELYQKVPSDLRCCLGIKDEELVITFVGRLIYAKGVQDLIKAFLILKDSLFNLRLLVVGKGDFEETLKRMSPQDSGIIFLGGKSREGVVEILSISDIFVNPSYSEGLPSVVLEAGAVGLPVIATDVGGTSEIIEDSVSGILFKPGSVGELSETLKKLIENPELRRTLSKNLRREVLKNYSWDKTVKKSLDFLGKI